MNDVKLYRQRFIPSEMVFLKDDIILSKDSEKIITRWNVLKPRKDFAKGISCYFIDKGIKISEFYSAQDKYIYTYCDIIETDYYPEENKYVFKDLLADVIIYKDGFVKVLDLEEIPEALDRNLITIEQAKKALRILSELLNIIYKGKMGSLTKHLEGFRV